MKNSSPTVFLFFIFTIITTIQMVDAWGADGHKAVGEIAQNILKPEIAQKVADLFQDPSFGGKLAPASIWADTIKRQRGSPFAFWSAPLHFMDTHDNPGKKCTVNEAADCPNGVCVVGAIANYTTQLDCENNFDLDTRDIALRFLTHFIGDITQPLHVCGREKGGNGVKVTFDGRSTNLHSIWDTDMVEKRLKDFNNDFKTYADHLTGEIINGTFANETQTWISCEETPRRRGIINYFNNIKKRAEATTRCALSWAVDTNAINCPLVWEAIDENSTLDLGGKYYEDSVSFIDQQIAKGGFRLGTFLNTILSKPCEN